MQSHCAKTAVIVFVAMIKVIALFLLSACIFERVDTFQQTNIVPVIKKGF